MSSIDFSNPLFWALFIAWVMSVILHEFAHGLVAHLGGDYTIRERGGLTLNPLQYIDPVMSIILPMLFLIMGGVPLPGGSTYIRRDLLRSRAWSTGVSLAGPLSNFLIFVALCVALHPALGWVHPHESALLWTPPQKLVGALAFLQLLAVLLNLIPIPPLDGFQAISPYLSQGINERLTKGPVPIILFIGLFLAFRSTLFMNAIETILRPIPQLLGVNFDNLTMSTDLILFGRI